MFFFKDHHKFYEPINSHFEDLKKLNLSVSSPDLIKFVLEASENLKHVEEIEICYLKSEVSYISNPKLYEHFFPETIGDVKKIVIISMESEENTGFLQNAIPEDVRYDIQVRKFSDSDILFKTSNI